MENTPMSRIEAAVAATKDSCPKCHAPFGVRCRQPDCEALPRKHVDGQLMDACMANMLEFKIAKLELKPGDILAIRPSEPRGPEDLRIAARSLRSLVPPGVRVIVVDADVSLTVIRPADDEYAAAAALAARASGAGQAAQKPIVPPGGHRYTEDSER